MAMGHEQPAPVTAAINRAAADAAVTPQAVEVIDIEQVDWSDMSLGVPEPGKLYGQRIVPGFRVTLRVGSSELIYHTDMNDRVVRAH